MEAILIKGGGGGVTSEDVTAKANDILKGTSTLTSDSNDEVTEGTLELTGNAQVGDVLAGSTFYNTNAHTKQTGTVPRNGQISGSLNCGQSKTIPAGHTTGGTITANSLASQTGGATAADGDVLSGKTYWKDGVKRTGTMANRGAVARELAAGGSYTIPEGYHNGGGKVTAKSLASQTGGATATDSAVLDGKTYWKDGAKRTGNIKSLGGRTITPSASAQTVSCSGKYMTGNVTINAISGLNAAYILKGKVIGGVTGTLAVQSAISFSAAARSHDTIRISWKNPAKGPWQGVFIQMSTSGNPGTGGGSRVYTGSGKNPSQAGGSNYVDITGLSLGTTYYFTCTSYCDALGWGNSYNVSCKTSGMVLYDNGKNPANLKFGADPWNHPENEWEDWWLTYTKVRFNSDHIDIPMDFSDHYSPEFLFGSGINAASFSKIFAEVQIVAVSTAYLFDCLVRVYDGSESYYNTSKEIDIRWYEGKRLTIECPLTDKNGFLKGIAFRSHKDQYVMGATGIKIYKIWAE